MHIDLEDYKSKILVVGGKDSLDFSSIGFRLNFHNGGVVPNEPDLLSDYSRIIQSSLLLMSRYVLLSLAECKDESHVSHLHDFTYLRDDIYHYYDFRNLENEPKHKLNHDENIEDLFGLISQADSLDLSIRLSNDLGGIKASDTLDLTDFSSNIIWAIIAMYVYGTVLIAMGNEHPELLKNGLNVKNGMFRKFVGDSISLIKQQKAVARGVYTFANIFIISGNSLTKDEVNDLSSYFKDVMAEVEGVVDNVGEDVD